MAENTESAAVTSSRLGTSVLSAAGLSIALLAVSAWVTLPLGAVPVTLQIFAVALTALLLEPVAATAAFGGYLLLGAAGVPVFSAMQGGMGVIAGPTGGYLIGFAMGGVVASMVRERLAGRVKGAVADGLAALALLLVVYAIGATQLALVTGLSPVKAFLAGVAPFVLVDLVKVVIAAGIAQAVRRALPGAFDTV